MTRPVRAPRWRGRGLRVLLLLVALGLPAAALFMLGVESVERPPRSLGPYLQQRVAGHNAALVAAGGWLAQALNAADRGESRIPSALHLRIGAQLQPSPSTFVPGSKIVPVASEPQAVQAIERARPGDVITFEPGVYRLASGGIAARQAANADAPIVVRALRPGTVVLEVQAGEGLVVSAPHWIFENLTIRGTCAQDADCEHAFHVVAGATHFVARNNTLIDFNAHIKVNGQDRRFPDHGLVEGNTITNTRARRTDGPVATIDIVGASGWAIRRNLITDFVKAQGDRVSYGGFAKGGGADNRFVGNVVLCEHLLSRQAPGQRVGLSLGGGGSGGEGGRAYCRDGACVPEQNGSVIASNLVASCSDDGIYVNRGASSRIVHNTLLDTGGIVVRFAESGAEVVGNLVDGAILSRDDGLARAGSNLQTGLTALYLGRHPQRALFRDSPALDLSWADSPPEVTSAAPGHEDLCGSKPSARQTYGAFEDFAACRERPR